MKTDVRATAISPQDLMALGVNYIAYVKPGVTDDQTVYAIHAADGTELAVLPSYTQAVAAIRQHYLELVSLH